MNFHQLASESITRHCDALAGDICHYLHWCQTSLSRFSARYWSLWSLTGCCGFESPSFEAQHPPRHLPEYQTVDTAKFTKLICSEKICTCPPVDTDELDASVMRVLDALATLRSRTVRFGKRSAKWLSPRVADGVSSGDGEGRMPSPTEWRIVPPVARLTWRSTASEATDDSWHRPESPMVRGSSTATHRWSTRWVNIQRLCSTSPPSFPTNFVRRVADEVAARLSTAHRFSNPPSSQPSLVHTYSLHHLDTEEVTRLIRSASHKSSPLDCMPTTLLKATVFQLLRL